MPTIREQRIELGGFGTRALVLDPTGEGGGDPLLLLHGWSDSADTWRPLLNRLSPLGRPAVALDLPGFGQADRLDRERDVLPQLDRFVAAAVAHESERCGGGDVVVVGNSLGGCAAIRAAENPGLQIRGVVALAPAGLDMAGWFGIIEGAPLVRFVLRAPVPLPEMVVREAVGRAYSALAYARPRDLDPAVVSGFTRHFRSRRDVVRLLATGKRLLPEIRDPFRLERIDCPMLLVWGDQDRMVFASGAERVLREVEGSRLEVVQRCGHCPQVEATDRMAELLSEFPGVLAAAG
jgi:pimeloyl-ACP methyl ester carboxylesterase